MNAPSDRGPRTDIPLLTNENFPRPAVLALRAAGVDVESVTEVMLGATDQQVLTHAALTALGGDFRP